jgi:hypothetical protein
MGSSDSGLRARWRTGAELVTACLPLAAVLLFVKHQLLFPVGWLRLYVEQAGQPMDPVSALGRLAVLRFFASDVIEALGIVPLVLLVASSWARPRMRAAVGFVAVALLIGFTLGAWLTVLAIGRLPTWDLAREYVGALRSEPILVSTSAYLPAGARHTAGLLALLGFLPAVFLIRRLVSSRAGRSLVAFGGAAGVGLLGLAIVLWLGTRNRTVLHGGTLSRTIGEFAGSGESLGEAGELGAAGLPRSWRWLALADSAPTTPPAPLPAGPACRSLVMLVLETASARDYAFEELKEGLPRARYWLERGLIARRHLSTHLRSNRAEFSLFSGV